MEFNTVESIKNNFCKNTDLTNEIVQVLGSLSGRQVKVNATGPVVGRIVHKIRYFLSKNYRAAFDGAAYQYLYNHTPKQREVAVVKTPPVPATIIESVKSISESVKTASIAPVKPKVEGPTIDDVFEKIYLTLGPNAQTLWRTLFDRFAQSKDYGKDWLKRITIDPQGNFQLHFTKPLKMHLISTDVDKKGKVFEDPPGGVVMIFGANNGPLTIRMEPGAMHFQGLQTFSKTPFGMGFALGRTVEAQLISFTSNNDKDFTITAFKELAISSVEKANTKPFEKILENWGKKATILPSNTDPASVILKK